MQRGGIWLIMIVIMALVGISAWVLNFSGNSLPGDFLYPVKKTSEDIRLATTEINYVARTSLYVELANKRLDEIDALRQKNAKPSLIVLAAQDFLVDEQKALREVNSSHTRTLDATPVKEEIQKLKDRQRDFFKDLLDNIPEPEFYKILEISEQSNLAYSNLGFRD